MGLYSATAKLIRASRRIANHNVAMQPYGLTSIPWRVAIEGEGFDAQVSG
jgi:hypothetical protein